MSKLFQHPYWRTDDGKNARARFYWFSGLGLSVGVLFLVSLYVVEIDILAIGIAGILVLILLTLETATVNTEKLRFDFEEWRIQHEITKDTP